MHTNQATATGDRPTPDRVVIVACGAKKEGPAAAGALYVGSYHRAMRRAADALTRDGGRVLILSALHGLVELDTVLAPYDMRMGEPGSVTASTLRDQAAALGLDGAEVTVLGGRAYVEAVHQVLPDALAPLAGSRGIGEQLGRLAAIYRDAPAEGTVALINRDAAARAGDTADRQESKRARLVTVSPVHVDPAGRAGARLAFPRAEGKGKDRAWAAAAYAPAYRVQVAAPGPLALAVAGAPLDVARYLSALPRLLDYSEELASSAARHYGRWERHSAAAVHLAELDARQRRNAARDFRAEAYRAAVETLVDVPDTDPVLGGRPAWDQAREVGITYARYGWVDIADRADVDEVEQLLADAEREAPAAAVPLPVAQHAAGPVAQDRAPELAATPARRPAAGPRHRAPARPVRRPAAGERAYDARVNLVASSRCNLTQHPHVATLWVSGRARGLDRNPEGRRDEHHRQDREADGPPRRR